MAKILLINNAYPSERFPGMGTYARTMAEELAEAGHDVSVLAIRYSGAGKGHKLKSYASFWWKLLTRDLSDYDAIYLHHFTYCFPVLFNRSLPRDGRKLVIHWHGKELVSTSRFDRILVRRLGKRLKKYRHIAPSRFFREKILKATPLAKEQIAVSPSGGVDLKAFSPRPEARDSKSYTIGFPGEIKATKGADVLLCLMESHAELTSALGRPVRFRIISYGTELDRFLPLFRATGADIDLMPRMKKADMPRFYQGLDVALVLSSAVIGESLGLVALEAMGCGVPVIAHDICAFPEFVVPGRSGELAPYSDSPEERARKVIEAIEKIARRPDCYDPRATAEKEYSRESVVQFYSKFFH